jgi:hypothetical protein
MATPDTPWKTWEKFSFRFFFLFLCLTSYLCWDATIYLVHGTLYGTPFDLGIMYKPIAPVLLWLDKHIYHIGFNPERQEGYPGDNHFGVVFYLAVCTISVLAAAVWGYLDRKKTNYNKLSYWFRLYLRYALGIVMFGYGIDKLIPVQMPHPTVMTLLTPYGYFDRFSVLWNSMGVAPGYMIFTGAAEVLAALLLFPHRTAIAGCLLTAAVMANVVALNFFYNITVKLFSSQLLFYSLFLLAPYLKNIFRFFFYNDATPFSQRRYAFYTGWKKYTLIAVLIVVPLTVLTINTTGIARRYGRNQADHAKERAYDVITFVAKDTLPPLTTDTLRWKRLLLFNQWHADRAVVMNMKDKPDWYQYEIDTVKKTLTLHEGPDKSTGKVLYYTNPSKDIMQLTGKWKGHDIKVSLKVFQVDSMYLNKEKIKVIRD